jgi:two-component system alkaline phosphatase synthesis response regulator PhoP
MPTNVLKKKIIVIDDDFSIRQLYSTKLSQEPRLKVLMAVDGQAGLKLIQEQKPDIVLLDIMMPHKDGFDVLEKVKKDKELKNIPIILLTNLANQEDKKQSLKLGATDYLVKVEHTPSEVLKRVKALLKI